MIYLQKLMLRLNAEVLPISKDLHIQHSDMVKLRVFQMLSELGSLVFHTSSCYSLVPNDLKQLNWEPILDEFNKHFKKSHASQRTAIVKLLNMFFATNHIKTFQCLVSFCLCGVLDLRKKTLIAC
jgi:hypothetical protein